jgi:tRNA pseudouridine65 synthase
LSFSPIEILFQDDYFVAINKPCGLLTHRTALAKHEDTAALQVLRDQLDKRVYPVHRLDRKTSGILIFALDKESCSLFQKMIEENVAIKSYLAIVRGYFPSSLRMEHPVINARNKIKNAITEFQLHKTTEIPIPSGQHTTSRYSLIAAFPKTGRMHQIRRHCDLLRHPIIGDRPYGCSKQNRLFKTKWGLNTMLLHSQRLIFTHPYTQLKEEICADLPDDFKRIQSILGL